MAALATTRRTGMTGNDEITGGTHNDMLRGLEGVDEIKTAATRNDEMLGGPDADILSGGPDWDKIAGGNGENPGETADSGDEHPQRQRRKRPASRAGRG